MKARIADEIARDDLTTQIGYAISDAISVYNNERFYFNETRDLTFYTVASQELYTSSDLADMPNILKIDWIKLYINNYPYRLVATNPEELEALNVSGTSLGQPYQYAWYQQKIRLYPIPTLSNQLVRIGGVVSQAPPASDGATGNVWMADCERLIRSRAKWELARHVLNDDDLATRMGGVSTDPDGDPDGGAIGDALKSLRAKTKRITQIGSGGFVQPTQF
jgi:hypothetical protein